jgi:ribosomal protein S18 acetylase RimI-like enzyme
MTEIHQWKKDGFEISTDPALIDFDAVLAAMRSDFIDWWTEIPTEEFRAMILNSLCFSLFATESSPSGAVKRTQIGFARVITDKVTVAYITDVYVLPEFGGKGHGSWMLACANELFAGWLHLRRTCLMSLSGKVNWYDKHLGLKKLDQGFKGLYFLSKTGPGASASISDS